MEQMDTGSTTSSGNFSPGMQADAPSGPSFKIDNPIDEEAVYICCGKPFGNKFMIFCEKCEEWFHGECIGIEQVDANNIDKYFCKDCLGKDNSLQIVYTRKYMMKLEKKKKEEEDVAAQRCGNCSNCLKAENKEEGCKTCVWCQSNQSNMCLTLRCSQAPAPPPKKKAGRPRKDQALTRSTSDEEGPLSPRSIPEDKDKPKRGRKKGWKKVQIIEKVTKQEESQAKQLQETTIQKRLAQAAYRTAKQRRNIMTEEPKQCLGIECVQEARPMSKYCSDDCGRSVARARLLKFLPQKVQEYWEHIPSVEIRYQQQAKEKEEQVLSIHKELSRLVDMAAMLERFVTSYVNAKPMEEAAVSALEGLSNCTVCGVEVSTRQLTAHIQRCFIKSEKQTAFGSTIQENQYNIFCNEYNKVSDTYCKRLKIMCPEHYKGELEGKMQICGCPSLWDSFKDKTPTFKDIFVSADQLMAKRICLAPRKECTKHQRWLQIALGVLSNERLNLLYKLNEIQEGYLASTHAQAMHGDVITLLCSGTREGPSEVKAEPMES